MTPDALLSQPGSDRMNELITSYDGRSSRAFHDAIYRGSVFRLAPSPASRRLSQYVCSCIERVLGSDPRQAQFAQDAETFFVNVGRLRRELYLSDACRRVIAELLIDVGSDPTLHVCDPMRLRVVTAGGHRNEAAAPVYYPHRDTWYSNPQTQITWWLALHDVTHRETFEFFPDCFDRPVENDSEVFDYDRWTSKGTDLKIGWQDRDAGKRERYPRLQEPLSRQRRVGFSAKRGEVIVFSGQHLHQTVPIDHGCARLSIDFRTVHLGDHRRRCGPANVDNRSSGDALNGHVPVTQTGQDHE